MSLLASRAPTQAFGHEAVLYDGPQAFVDAVLPFLEDALAIDAWVAVVAVSDRLARTREALGEAQERVAFLDMEKVGGNPARIIPVMQDIVAAAPEGRQVCLVGEPVWPGRRAVELAECHLHEALVNLAFEDAQPVRLLCTYDSLTLADHVIDDALRTHPWSRQDGRRFHTGAPMRAVNRGFAAPLDPAPEDVAQLDFSARQLSEVRGLVAEMCAATGVVGDKAEDLMLAMHELATNSVLHGGGRGRVLAWAEPEALVVEVRDHGTIDNFMVGREVASELAEGGRGVWLANQLCDLVQLRSSGSGTVVRVHTWRQSPRR